MVRKSFFAFAALSVLLNVWGYFFFQPLLWSLILLAPLVVVGLVDSFQTEHTIRRNFPLIGNLRYLLENIRPEVNQYFIESNCDGKPFSREDRSVIYQRAKHELDTLPFGTQKDVYDSGYEWVNHSLAPQKVSADELRVMIGGPDCLKPYSASIFNISAMSYGALSGNAIRALNHGARLGGFAHNTGEGGVSPYHLEGGGDLIWQIGTGYFGCRTREGGFCENTFTGTVKRNPQIKMIELKLSQGAKPAHGGILPGAKVSREIAEIRHVPEGQDVISPPAHSTFNTPVGMLHFIARLRELSGGLPVGMKLCIGKRREFLAVCKAMVKTGITPDYIAVDGGEGGTGAAPLEFSNYIGCPLTEALMFVHNSLVGCNLRDRVRVIAGGKALTGFGVVKRLSRGADICYAARPMMLALGCIQALRCNTNHCPSGVATQDKSLASGLVVKDKKERVREYHRATVASVAEIVGAMGLRHTQDLRPWHIMRRLNFTSIRHYGELYPFLKPGDLLKDDKPEHFERAWNAASAETFEHINDDPGL